MYIGSYVVLRIGDPVRYCMKFKNAHAINFTRYSGIYLPTTRYLPAHMVGSVQ